MRFYFSRYGTFPGNKLLICFNEYHIIKFMYKEYIFIRQTLNQIACYSEGLSRMSPLVLSGLPQECYVILYVVDFLQGPLLLSCINFNPSMDK